MVRAVAIELPDGNRIKEVNLNGYKYLGVWQLDSIMNREMKETMKSEYIRRVKMLLRSKLNGGNVISGMNIWTVDIIRYGTGVLDWKNEEWKSIDIKTRKLRTMNGILHLRANVGRLLLAREKGRRGLIICEECMNVEVQSLNNNFSEREE